MTTLDRYSQQFFHCNYNQLNSQQKILIDRYVYDDD